LPRPRCLSKATWGWQAGRARARRRKKSRREVDPAALWKAARSASRWPLSASLIAASGRRRVPGHRARDALGHGRDDGSGRRVHARGRRA